MTLVPLQVKIYQGKGWLGKFKRTHFDSYTPPDFYVKVDIHTYIISIIIMGKGSAISGSSSSAATDPSAPNLAAWLMAANTLHIKPLDLPSLGMYVCHHHHHHHHPCMLCMLSVSSSKCHNHFLCSSPLL